MKKIGAVLLFLTIIQLSSLAQSTVKLSGKILDERANPISNATVRLLNTIPAQSQLTGNFSIPNVAAGNYTVLISDWIC